MKLLEEMMLVKVADEYMVVPTARGTENFSGVVRLNVTGKDIWEGVGQGLGQEQIAEMLVNKYEDVDFETALGNVKRIVETLKKEGLILD